MNRRNFLVTLSATVVMTQLSTVAKAAVDSVKKIPGAVEGLWKNWSGNISFKPKNVLTPKSLEEASSLIKAANKVRAAGAGHSFNSIVPEQTLILSSHLKKISIDKKNLTVTAQAGVTLRELNARLAEEKLAFPSLGEIDSQTVAGLVSTGTRGTGIEFGSLSDADSLLGMTLIDAEGEIHEFDFTDARNEQIAKALRLGLGAFGYVTSVTFRVCEEFNLKESRVVSTLPEALVPKHYLDHYRYSFYYYPHSDMTILKYQDKTDERPNLSERERTERKEKLMENKLANKLLEVASHFPSLIPRMVKIFASTMKDVSYTDTWRHVMITERTMRYFELQYSFPVEMLPEVMKKCKERVTEFTKKGLYYSDLPFFVRYGRGDQGTLISPSQGQGIFAQVDVNAHYAQKGYEPFFRALESDFVKLGGRPHWGKLFYVQPQTLFDGIDEFEKLRIQFDPRGKFQNDFIKRHISG